MGHGAEDDWEELDEGDDWDERMERLLKFQFNFFLNS
jgi:hypothetical protein